MHAQCLHLSLWCLPPKRKEWVTDPIITARLPRACYRLCTNSASHYRARDRLAFSIQIRRILIGCRKNLGFQSETLDHVNNDLSSILIFVFLKKLGKTFFYRNIHCHSLAQETIILETNVKLWIVYSIWNLAKNFVSDKTILLYFFRNYKVLKLKIYSYISIAWVKPEIKIKLQ